MNAVLTLWIFSHVKQRGRGEACSHWMLSNVCLSERVLSSKVYVLINLINLTVLPYYYAWSYLHILVCMLCIDDVFQSLSYKNLQHCREDSFSICLSLAHGTGHFDNNTIEINEMFRYFFTIAFSWCWILIV